MLSRVVQRELLCPLNYKISSQFQCLTAHRSASKSTSTQLPNSVPILKPAGTAPSSAAALRIKTISKAMKAYLERSKNHDKFLLVKNEEFEIGRLHLANIMGLDANTMTQEDIDKAIAYLFPSGLFEKNARPKMKPPLVLFPKEKAAQFGDDGRPFSPFFYTRKGGFHESLHEIVATFHKLDDLEDKMIQKGILEVPESSRLLLGGGEWISMQEMAQMFLEPIHQLDHAFFISTSVRLGQHPYSFRCKELFKKYRKEFTNIAAVEEIPELMTDDEGRPYMEGHGRRKWAEAKVVVRGNGTGKIRINDRDIFYFKNVQDREQIMYPLEFTDLLGLVDIEADVTSTGDKAQAGAIRLGISYCLRSFVEPNLVEKMRLAGLLTEDMRRRGRKIPGQKGCRAKYTWKKR